MILSFVLFFSERSGKMLKILLVDDDPVVLEIRRRQLTSAGYVVITATNGAEALEIWKANEEILLVLTDNDMPLMTGTELVETIKRSGRGTQTIILSGRPGEVPSDLPDFLLAKPIERESLLKTVAIALNS